MFYYLTLFLSLGRHSRYVRWRRDTDTVNSKNSVTTSGHSAPPKSQPLPTESQQKIAVLKSKLLQLITRFADLFLLFEDEYHYTQEYLDQTDDLIYM